MDAKLFTALNCKEHTKRPCLTTGTQNNSSLYEFTLSVMVYAGRWIWGKQQHIMLILELR